MKRLAVLLVALVAAGCGTTVTGAGSSGEDSVLVPTTAEKGLDESTTKPPPLVLVNAAGKQIGAPGSSCVQYTDPSSGQGVGVCADMAGPVHPDALTVVQPGERVMIMLAGAFVTDEGSVSVHPLGCTDQEKATFDLARGMSVTRWQVNLEPGAYELDAFARFGSNDGREGDLSGSLGLLVAPDRAPSILPMDAGLAVCPFFD